MHFKKYLYKTKSIIIKLITHQHNLLTFIKINFKKYLTISYFKNLFLRIYKKYHQECMSYYVESKKDNNINNNNPKIIGILLTWNNLLFFKYALQQALEFCDEVLIVEGCHFQKYPKRSTDGTFEYIKNLLPHPKLRLFDFNFTGRNDIVQLKIRIALLKYSKYCKPGNWIIQWDDDNFFFEENLIKITKIIKNTNYDTLVFKERRFIFNFRFNTFTNQRGQLNRGGGQIDRITEGAFFKGVLKKNTHPRLYYKYGMKYNNILYSEI